MGAHLVAGGPKGVDRVAFAALATVTTGQVPGVGSAAVAVLANHVGLAGTLATLLLTLAVIGGLTGLGRCARHMAHALCKEYEKFGVRGFCNFAKTCSCLWAQIGI